MTTTWPDPPPTLPAPQQAIWRETTQALTDADTTARVDPNSIAAYVAAVHAHREATRLLSSSAVLVIRGGTPTPNPALQVQRQAANTIRNFDRAWGLTSRKAPQLDMQAVSPMHPHGQLGRWCEEHGRYECTHQRSRGRGQCHGPAKFGTDGCRMHAGSRQDLKHEAAKARRVGGYPLNVTPSQVLLQEVKYWAGLCAWLDEVIAGMDEGELVWGTERRMVRSHGPLPGAEVTEAAGLSMWVQWHAQAHAHNLKAAEAALRGDVEERLVRMAEADGARIFGAMNRGLVQLKLSDDQWAAARVVMPKVLRELVSG